MEGRRDICDAGVVGPSVPVYQVMRAQTINPSGPDG